MELLDFVEFFGKVSGGRGTGKGRGKLLYLYRVKVSGGGESLTLAINASHTPLSVLKRRIQFLLITNWRMYGSHFWPRGGWESGRAGN